MSKVNTLTVKNNGVPERLLRIPAFPKQLFYIGEQLDTLLARPGVAIVGSRNVSPYGRQVGDPRLSDKACRAVLKSLSRQDSQHRHQ